MNEHAEELEMGNCRFELKALNEKRDKLNNKIEKLRKKFGEI